MNFFTATQGSPSYSDIVGRTSKIRPPIVVRDFNGSQVFVADASPAQLTVGADSAFSTNPTDAGGSLGQPVNGASVGSLDPGSSTAFSAVTSAASATLQKVTGMTGTQLLQWLVVLVIGFFFLKFIGKHFRK